MSKQGWKTCKSEKSVEIHLAAKKMHVNNKSNTKFVTDLLSFIDNWNESLDFIGNPIFSRNPENFWNWIELNWIPLCKVSYVILELHNRSHVLNICLNNAIRSKLIMTIIIKKISILRRSLSKIDVEIYILQLYAWLVKYLYIMR